MSRLASEGLGPYLERDEEEECSNPGCMHPWGFHSEGDKGPCTMHLVDDGPVCPCPHFNADGGRAEILAQLRALGVL